MKTRIVQIALLAYLLFCIYLVTFAGIDFKELQNENWLIRTSYMIGVVACMPVGLLLGLAPESWNPGVFVSNLVVGALSALLIMAIVFHRSIFGFFKKTGGG